MARGPGSALESLNMKTFHCDGCGNLVFFENVNCVKCGHALGFLPSRQELSALEPQDGGTWRALARDQTGQLFKFCDNAQHHVCNWMVETDDANPFCQACRLNELIPDLSVPDNLTRWQKLETAKHRVVYTLLRLGLPMDAAAGEGRPSLRFKFAGDVAGAAPVVTGHADGLITVNIAEADDDERERRRINLHEPYRTLLGHLRHEVSHYYWDRLIAGSKWLPEFRALFGDETADYGAALDRYYKHGPPQDWQARHVSSLCQRASVGRLGGNRGALFSHHGHGGDGGKFWNDADAKASFGGNHDRHPAKCIR